MGTEQIVDGYIDLEVAFEDLNASVVQEWQFGEIYPFTNIFSFRG